MKTLLKVLYHPTHGDCRFRAVSLAVYGEQGKWVLVKEEMLKPFKENLKYYHPYYTIDVEEFIAMFKDRSAPCRKENH